MSSHRASPIIFSSHSPFFPYPIVFPATALLQGLVHVAFASHLSLESFTKLAEIGGKNNMRTESSSRTASGEKWARLGWWRCWSSSYYWCWGPSRSKPCSHLPIVCPWTSFQPHPSRLLTHNLVRTHFRYLIRPSLFHGLRNKRGQIVLDKENGRSTSLLVKWSVSSALGHVHIG